MSYLKACILQPRRAWPDGDSSQSQVSEATRTRRASEPTAPRRVEGTSSCCWNTADDAWLRNTCALSAVLGLIYTSNFPILHKCLSLLFSHQARSMCFTCDDRTTQWLHRQEGENVSQAPPGTHENRGHRYLNISTAPTMSRTNQKSLF